MFYFTSILSSPITWVIFSFGLIVGSFLNVCIFRIPEGVFFKNSRSVCPSCGTVIKWKYNIPVLSYILLKGRSACCHKTISVQYPLVELFTGIMFAIIYWKFPFLISTNELAAIDYQQLLRFTHAIIFCSALLVCSVIDLHLMIIPDVISLSMIALTPIVVFLHPDLDWFSSFVGVLVGGGVLYAVAWLYWIVRKDYGLGMGDVKLLAGIGGWLGYQSIFPTILIASILGSFIGIFVMLCSRKLSMKSQIPFGPFLSLGAVLHLLFGHQLLEWIAT